jgi:hypothetical protein
MTEQSWNVAERARAAGPNGVSLLVEVSAVIASVDREAPQVLCVGTDGAKAPAALPSGPLAADKDRTLELALGSWVREQTEAGPLVSEASAGITPSNALELAATGVGLLSLGRLTHGVPALDVSLGRRFARHVLLDTFYAPWRSPEDRPRALVRGSHGRRGGGTHRRVTRHPRWQPSGKRVAATAGADCHGERSS